MSRYYYLAAQLPSLGRPSFPPRAGEAPPSPETFLALCREQLSPADFALLAALMAGERPEGSAFARELAAAESVIGAVTAAHRLADRPDAPELRVPPGVPERRSLDPHLAREAAQALGEPDPLHRELALDALYLRLLDRLGGNDPFRAEAIFAYGLGLSLLHRWAGLSAQAGQARLDLLVRDAVETALGKTPESVAGAAA